MGFDYHNEGRSMSTSACVDRAAGTVGHLVF